MRAMPELATMPVTPSQWPNRMPCMHGSNTCRLPRKSQCATMPVSIDESICSTSSARAFGAFEGQIATPYSSQASNQASGEAMSGVTAS
eukprot:scaffold111995_cov112-Phaeocystis_antarctica.AAC.3